MSTVTTAARGECCVLEPGTSIPDRAWPCDPVDQHHSGLTWPLRLFPLPSRSSQSQRSVYDFSRATLLMAEMPGLSAGLFRLV